MVSIFSLSGISSGYSIWNCDSPVSAGAGFVVCETGKVMTMPGLPKVPAANGMDILSDGTIIGLS